MQTNKQILKKYLGKTPFFLDLRKKSILKDNIDIGVWENNMQFLENTSDWGLRDKAHPLVCTIIDGDVALPPTLWKTADRNWFIAAYPDVIIYFYPTADLELSEAERTEKRQGIEEDFQKLQEYLGKFKLNQNLALFYMKKFYKEVLKKEFLLSEK